MLNVVKMQNMPIIQESDLKYILLRKFKQDKKQNFSFVKF
jgi:hypothetical protein